VERRLFEHTPRVDRPAQAPYLPLSGSVTSTVVDQVRFQKHAAIEVAAPIEPALRLRSYELAHASMSWLPFPPSAY